MPATDTTSPVDGSITWERLASLIAEASFQSAGDTLEKQYGASFSGLFPALEEFWKHLIVPATRRIETPVPAESDRIRLRDDVGQRVQDLAALNHSVFANLIDAQEDIQSGRRCMLEDALFHLGTCCDLTEEFLLTSYFLVLECTDSHSPTLQSLSKEAFLELASRWYDTAYPTLAEHYFAKGKGIPIRIPNTRHVLAEYFAGIPAWKEYLRASQEIRTYRNVMTHTPRIARAFDDGGLMWVPRIDLIAQYKAWANVEHALRNPPRADRDFVPAVHLVNGELARLGRILNLLWERPLADLKKLLVEQNIYLLRQLALEILTP